MPLPPLPTPHPASHPPAAAAATVSMHPPERGSGSSVEDLLAARTLRARFDLDEAELEAVCAALTPVTVGPLKLARYRLSEVAALLTVDS